MDVLDAIYHRRSVRHYSDATVTRGVVRDLLLAAVQAPSAQNLQPWAFAIFHGRDRLKAYSTRAKAHLLATQEPSFGLDPNIDRYDNQKVNVFHDADTLIVIFATPGRFTPVEDCLLAGENLMLAAHGMGLGSCPIGFARSWFNLPEIKAECKIPANYIAVLPIVVGYPAAAAPAVPREEAEIACWHWDE
ncbi:MAG: nitroreductase family protein [Lacunisphaera sp.]